VDLTEQEKESVAEYLEVNVSAVLDEAIKFERAKFKSEIHSSEYTLRTKCSTDLAITYDQEGQIKDYFGTIQKIFLIAIDEQIHRLAFVNTFYFVGNTRNKINRTLIHQKGKIIPITSIDRKVIFVGPANNTHVLSVPFHESN